MFILETKGDHDMPLCKIYGIRLCCLIVLSGCALALNACGLHRTVLLELERHERIAAQEQREKTLAEITMKEQEALATQTSIKIGEIIPQLYGQALLQGTWAGIACNE